MRDTGMNVLHVSTRDIAGGAARATYRLHRAMLTQGAHSVMACQTKDSNDESVFEVQAALAPVERAGARRTRQAVSDFLLTRRTGVSDTIFTASIPGVDLACLPEARPADAVVMHWVSQFVSAESIRGLLGLGKPVAWRLSDMWPFTGGCHYSGGCEAFTAGCEDCPQIDPALRAFPAAMLKARREALAGGGLTVVSPSRWLAGLARRSALLRDCRVEVIPNGVNAEVFRPEPGARRRLGLPAGHAFVLFVATHAERRKGFGHLLNALAVVRETLGATALPDGRRLALMVTGDLDVSDARRLGIPAFSFGAVDDDSHLRRIYSAADVFAFASMEENFPSTVLEAMACALPVAGFSTGGTPDLVEHGETGLLAAPGDAGGLGRSILDCLLNPNQARRMGLAARRRVEREFRVETQARRYLGLLGELARDRRGALSGQAVNGRAALEAARIERDLIVQALGQAPDTSAEAAIGKAFSLRDQGRPFDGAGLLEGMLLLHPDDPGLLGALGAVLASAGRTGQAVERFRRRLVVEPWNHGVLLNISDALRYAGRHEQALEVLSELEDRAPCLRGLHLKRGQVLAAMGRHRESARSLACEVRRHGGREAGTLLAEQFALRNSGRASPLRSARTRAGT